MKIGTYRNFLFPWQIPDFVMKLTHFFAESVMTLGVTNLEVLELVIDEDQCFLIHFIYLPLERVFRDQFIKKVSETHVVILDRVQLLLNTGQHGNSPFD